MRKSFKKTLVNYLLVANGMVLIILFFIIPILTIINPGSPPVHETLSSFFTVPEKRMLLIFIFGFSNGLFIVFWGIEKFKKK